MTVLLFQAAFGRMVRRVNSVRSEAAHPTGKIISGRWLRCHDTTRAQMLGSLKRLSASLRLAGKPCNWQRIISWMGLLRRQRAILNFQAASQAARRFQAAYLCLQQHLLHPAILRDFHKLVQPILAQNPFCHFYHNVIRRQIVVFGIAA